MSTATHARSAIGERIESLCFEQDVSFNDLCTRLEIDRATLHKWRSSKYRAPKAIVTLVMLADTFGVSTDWLLGRTSERRPR